MRRLALAALLALAGCNGEDDRLRQGYIEGEFVYVSSPYAGYLDRLAVERGAQVAAGDALFALDDVPERAARDELERRRAQASATLADVRAGKRPTELESLRAQLEQARAGFALAEKELERQELLDRTPGATAQQVIDRTRSVRDQERAKVAQLEADLQTAQLGSRTDQVLAAEENLRAIETALEKARWDVAQKSQAAPVAGVVFDTLYRPGEWVAAGRPVVSLLPPENVKLRVYVPQEWLAGIHVGDELEVRIDGASNTRARVSFIAPSAEFTPPIVYSRENRAKFVFLVEARFDPGTAAGLHPGHPVDVRFAQGGGP